MGCVPSTSTKVAPAGSPTARATNVAATASNTVGAAFFSDGCPQGATATAGTGTDPGLAMFIIDPQNDFHPPSGSLAVPGAVEDTERIIAIIDRLGDQVPQRCRLLLSLTGAGARALPSITQLLHTSAPLHTRLPELQDISGRCE